MFIVMLFCALVGYVLGYTRGWINCEKKRVFKAAEAQLAKKTKPITKR